MQLLDETAYEAVRPLLTQTISLHASVAAILAGELHGQILADDPNRPAVVLVTDGEASYLAGDAGRPTETMALRDLIPAWTYFFPEDNWVPRLAEIWDNPFARMHPRLRFQLTGPPVEAQLPDGFELVQLDRTSVSRYTALATFAEGAADGWRSFDRFLDTGIGYCVVHDGAVVSHCLADCVFGSRAELGVGSDEGFRRLGLARAAAAAAVAECLRRGIVDVAWHCHASNAGSIRIAAAIGMLPQGAHTAYSSNLPAENAGDLSAAQCRDWGQHLETAAASVIWHGFHAAGAWTLAGEPDRALRCLDRLARARWQGQPEWLEGHWAFAAIRDTPAFKAIVARQRVG